MLIAGSLFMLLHLPYFRSFKVMDDLANLESGLPVFESNGIAIEIIDADKEEKDPQVDLYPAHRHYQQHNNHSHDVIRHHSVDRVSREVSVVVDDDAGIVHASDSGHLEGEDVADVIAEMDNESYITLEAPTVCKDSSAVSLAVIVENENNANI